MNRVFSLLLWLALGYAGAVIPSVAQQRFPPPDFESGYRLPSPSTPLPRAVSLEYLDLGLLIISLGLASYWALKGRSRKRLLILSLCSLAYFGFYRQGCICAIGSVQNVALGLFQPSYAMPLTALGFFLAPLVVALFAGRTFCAAVCPHGALQDVVLLKPLKVPAWLEHGLGLIPYMYLGAAVAFAATGTAFIICRYDPFVPLFRLSGRFWMLLLGDGFLVLAMFVGRPYCRFVCPYGALLKLAAKVSKWRVTITPDVCTQCRLCESSCPFGAIQEPVRSPLTAQSLHQDRRRLGSILLTLPLLVMVSGWLGATLAAPASRLDPTVALAERYLGKNPVPSGIQTAAALAMIRAEQDPKALLERAMTLRRNFVRAGWFFGGWVGLVVGLKLAGLALRQRREVYEPDRGACLACGRCFTYCPNERIRCGLAPLATIPSPPVAPGLSPTAPSPVQS